MDFGAKSQQLTAENISAQLYAQVNKKFPIQITTIAGVVTGLKIDDSTLTTTDRQAIQNWVSTNLTTLQLGQGVYAPLYSWNANGYQQVVANKQRNPTVSMVAVINPNSGPGTAFDSTINTAVKAMQAVGITVLGYVGTNYGSELTKAQYPVGNPWPSSTPNELSSVQNRCLQYQQWYSIDGFMFDDFSNTQFITMPDSTQKDVYTNFYVPLFKYARGLPGIKVIKGNMGTKPLYQPLVDLCDLVCVFENNRNPTLTELQNNTLNGQLKSKAVIVVNSTNPLDTNTMSLCGKYAQYYYSSDAGYAQPPAYYNQMISTLASQ